MQTVAREIDELELNSIKEKMSIAYLHGLNAHLNYSIQKSDKDFDALGIDFEVNNKVVGPGRTVASEANTINIQLKGVSISSTSMIKDEEHQIKYNLTKSLAPIGVHYLVIVVLPKEEDLVSWCEVTTEELILRKCAYYFHVPSSINRGFINIPKTNVLNLETFPKLFDAAKLVTAT